MYFGLTISFFLAESYAWVHGCIIIVYIDMILADPPCSSKCSLYIYLGQRCMYIFFKVKEFQQVNTYSSIFMTKMFFYQLHLLILFRCQTQTTDVLLKSRIDINITNSTSYDPLMWLRTDVFRYYRYL